MLERPPITGVKIIHLHECQTASELESYLNWLLTDKRRVKALEEADFKAINEKIEEILRTQGALQDERSLKRIEEKIRMTHMRLEGRIGGALAEMMDEYHTRLVVTLHRAGIHAYKRPKEPMTPSELAEHIRVYMEHAFLLAATWRSQILWHTHARRRHKLSFLEINALRDALKLLKQINSEGVEKILSVSIKVLEDILPILSQKGESSPKLPDFLPEDEDEESKFQDETA